MKKRDVFSAYFESLSKGDPEAIGITAIIAVCAIGLLALVGFVIWRSKREDRKYQEELRERRGY